MNPISLRAIVCIAAAMIVAGCATRATSIDAQWMNPAVASRDSVRSVLVIGALRDSTQRRLFEERMVEALNAAGVEAKVSHRYLADSPEITENQLRDAVAAAGASHVLISSVSGMTTDVRVTPGTMSGPGWGPGWGPTPMGPSWRGMSSYYSRAWSRSMPPEVRTTQNLHGDTRLFDVASSEVVWSMATTTVTNRDSVQGIVDQFTQLVVDTLREDAVI